MSLFTQDKAEVTVATEQSAQEESSLSETSLSSERALFTEGLTPHSQESSLFGQHLFDSELELNTETSIITTETQRTLNIENAPPISEDKNRDLELIIATQLMQDEALQPMTDLLKSISTQHGIPLHQMNLPSEWTEDGAVLLGNGPADKLLYVPTTNEDSAISNALIRIQILGMPELHPDQGRSAYSSKDGIREADYIAQKATEAGFTVKKGSTYIEGGNVLTTRTPEGEPMVLIGKTTLMLNREVLKQRGQLDQNEVEKMLQTQSFTAEEREFAGRIAKWEQPDLEQFQLLRETDRVLAEMELTKQAIAADLNTAPDSVHFISQNDFHIDVDMRIVDSNTVALKDPNLFHERAAELLQNDPNLSEDDKRLLGKALEVRNLAADSIPKLNKMQSELEALGFTVKRVPGEQVHLTTAPKPMFEKEKVDALKGLTLNGTLGTAQDGSVVYITNSTGSEALDETLMPDLMKALDADHVYFLPHEFRSGGFDCLTLG